MFISPVFSLRAQIHLHVNPFQVYRLESLNSTTSSSRGSSTGSSRGSSRGNYAALEQGQGQGQGHGGAGTPDVPNAPDALVCDDEFGYTCVGDWLETIQVVVLVVVLYWSAYMRKRT